MSGNARRSKRTRTRTSSRQVHQQQQQQQQQQEQQQMIQYQLRQQQELRQQQQETRLQMVRQQQHASFFQLPSSSPATKRPRTQHGMSQMSQLQQQLTFNNQTGPANDASAGVVATSSRRTNNNNNNNAGNKRLTGNIGSMLLSRILDHDNVHRPIAGDDLSWLVGKVPESLPRNGATSATNATGSGSGIGTANTYSKLVEISNFLTHHNIVRMATAAAAAVNPTPSTSNSTNASDEGTKGTAETKESPNTSDASNDGEPMIITAAPYYKPTIQDFSKSQLDRQAAGLRTNTNGETMHGLSQIIQAHSEALKKALQTKSKLPLFSKRELCAIHETLMPASLGPSAVGSGRFRTNQARAGYTYFCPPQQVDSELDKFMHALDTLYATRWDLADLSTVFSSQQPTNDAAKARVSKTFHAIALAAVALYGINDIHPFRDGNGRLSRICCNYVLINVLGLPFTVTLVATAEQRREYIEGMRQGHMLIQLHQDHHSSASVVRRRQRSNNLPETRSPLGPAFQPLINMLIDRIAHAVTQVKSVLSEKARTANDEEESRIVRRVRENAAKHGQCLICLDEKPNIATLCCGQAVHLNCIAEWLANQSTCVGCRAPLPPMNTGRQRRPAPTVADETNDEDTYSIPDDDSQSVSLHDDEQQLDDTNHEMLRQLVIRAMNPEATETVSDEAEEDTTTHVDEDTVAVVEQLRLEAEQAAPTCTACNNRAAVGCGNLMCGRCCGVHGIASCTRHGVNRSEDTTTTTTSVAGGNADEEEEEAEEDTSTTTDSDGDNDNDASTTTTTMTSLVGNNNNNNRNYQQCLQCLRNRAALDCTNQFCGRCCILHGRYQCQRHG